MDSQIDNGLSSFDLSHLGDHSLPPMSQLATMPAAEQGLHKVINDPIWGYNVSLPPMLVALVDTPHFQRLRELKQLGTCYYVFPGAAHNRFEHSIGTAHLAAMMVRNIMTRQPELQLTERDVLLVSMAGLCHDLGHGPFSHVFDNEFIPAVEPHSTWKHEQASVMMLNAAVKDAGLDNVDKYREDALRPDELTFVHELINPPPERAQYSRQDRLYLYEIVSNARNSIDVDKFDYLVRDASNVGIKVGLDPKRLMMNCKVIGDEICYHYKEAFPLYELFHTRYSMFKQVYSHRVVKAVEYMVRDVLILADPVLDIKGGIHSADAYLKLNDAILTRIECTDDERLAPAKALLGRIRRRRLYRQACEAMIPYDRHWSKVTPADVLAHLPAESAWLGIGEHDIVVQNLVLNYAKKDKNPMDAVSFFKHWGDTESFKLAADQVSLLAPQRFQERLLRVFVKEENLEKYAAVQQAANEFLRARFETSEPAAPTNAVFLTQQQGSTQGAYGAQAVSSPAAGSMSVTKHLAQLARANSALYQQPGATQRLNNFNDTAVRTASQAGFATQQQQQQGGDALRMSQSAGSGAAMLASAVPTSGARRQGMPIIDGEAARKRTASTAGMPSKPSSRASSASTSAVEEDEEEEEDEGKVKVVGSSQQQPRTASQQGGSQPKLSQPSASGSSSGSSSSGAGKKGSTEPAPGQKSITNFFTKMPKKE